MELAEGFAEGLDGEVVGIGGVVGHAQEHEVDRLAIEAHEVGIGTLVALLAGGQHQLVIALGLVVSFFETDVFTPRHSAITM